MKWSARPEPVRGCGAVRGSASDVTTLDIAMPEKDGITALKEIIAADPEARV